MANCKDCLYVEVCNDYAINYLKPNSGTPIEALEKEVGDYPCCRFQDSSLFVKLPCKIGNKLYLSTESINKILHLLGTYESSPELFEIVPEKQIKQALAEQEQRNNTD